MLDRGLAVTFKNFATLFFVCAVITIPLHVTYAIVFKNEIGLRELHAQIESFPPLREVKGVSKHDLDVSRLVSGGLAVFELLLVPLALKAARRVIDDDAENQVTTVGSAWSSALSRGYAWARDLPGGGGVIVIAAAAIAIAVGVAADRVGALMAEPFSPTYAFAIVGPATALARAVAAPLFLGPVAFACLRKKGIASPAT